MSKTKSRNFCFTINNYTEKDIEHVKAMECVACVAGLEVGEEGTPHIQGAVIFKHAITFKCAQTKIMGSTCHTERMQGKYSANVDYCSKGEQSHKEWETDKINGPNYGRNADVFRCDDYEDSKQGARNDIDAFRDAIKATKSNAVLLETHGLECSKYPRFITFVRDAFPDDPADLPIGSKANMGTWVWSREGGMGKSSWIRRTHPKAYEKNETKWWCNYTDQEVVYIDEPSPSNAKQIFNDLKIWVQEKPFRIEEKGVSGRLIRPKRFYVFANYAPDEFFGAVWHRSVFDGRFKTVELTTPIFTEGPDCFN